MKNFVKILFLMLMTLFIVSCSSDARVSEIAESEAMVTMAGDKAECVAKEATKDMSEDELATYHEAVTKDAVGELVAAGGEEDELAVAVLGKHSAAMLECGAGPETEE